MKQHALTILLRVTLCFLSLKAPLLQAQPQNSSTEGGPAPQSDFYAVAVMGDQPYGQFFEPATTRLLEAINGDAISQFILHTGDIKGGGETCDNALLTRRLNQLRQSRKALVYTVGDNEWTDCHRDSNGSFEPQERLSFLRQIAFSSPQTTGTHQTLGQTSFEVRNQAPEGFPEHQMFQVDGTLFVTLNVPGSNNNLLTPASRKEDDATVWAQYEYRMNAIDRWLSQAESLFKQPENSLSEWIVLIQGNPIDGSGQSWSLARLWESTDGYEAFMQRLILAMNRINRPLLLIHGDTHRFKWDKPDLSGFSPAFRDNENGPGFYRLEAYGHPFVNHYVRLRVRSGHIKPFEVETVSVETH